MANANSVPRWRRFDQARSSSGQSTLIVQAPTERCFPFAVWSKNEKRAELRLYLYLLGFFSFLVTNFR